MTKRRTTYHVLPRGSGWGCKLSGAWIVVWNTAQLLDKETYVAAVKQTARAAWKLDGRLSEVIIHNRNGQIGKGSESRVTYGKDPRKSKG